MSADGRLPRMAFIGSGVMAEAMIRGLLRDDLVDPGDIIASGPRPERGQELRSRYGVRPTVHNPEAAAEAEIVILSVKPQLIPRVLPELRGHIRPGALTFSIAAGVRIATLREGLGVSAIIRAMPNTPAQIGQGITVWTATDEVTPRQREQAILLMRAMGEEVYVDDERYLDMATALTGTGPAYVFLFMEAMVDAGVHLGFSRRVAEQLVYQTVIGSALYARQSGLHPAALRNQVTSPGGTTAEALYHLEKGGFRTVISRAIWAAYVRSRQLGRGAADEVERLER